MNTFYLCLGSNVDPERHVPETIQTLKRTFHVTAISTVYETNPVGPSGKDKFWNAVLKIQTELDRRQLTEVLRGIESKHGRVRNPDNKFSPRTIDIDIVPKKEDLEMAFIMKPLAEVAPDDKHESCDKTYREIAEELRAEAKEFKKVEL